MKQLLLLTLLFIAGPAFAGQPWIFGPGKAVNLTNSIEYKNLIQMMAGSSDPTSTAVSAPTGSMYLSTNGSIYVKQDMGLTTNWLVLSASGGGGGLTAINGQSGPTVSIAAGTSGTDVGIAASANTITVNIPTASASNRGVLSSANWTTFNNKEPAITATTSADLWQGDKTFIAKSALPISTATQTALDLKADQTEVDDHGNSITVIEADIDAIESDISDLQAADIALQADADAAYTLADAATTDIAALDLRVDDTESDISALQTDVADDVEGPASSTDNAIARYDGTTGKLLQNSGVIIDDGGTLRTSDLDVITNNTTLTVGTTADEIVTVAPIDNLSATSWASANSAITGENATLANPASGVIHLTNSALVSIDMIPYVRDGQQLYLINTTGNSIFLNDQTGGTAANRILTGASSPIAIPNSGVAILIYSGSLDRWVVSTVSGSSSGSVYAVQSFYARNTTQVTGGVTAFTNTESNGSSCFTVQSAQITVIAPCYFNINASAYDAASTAKTLNITLNGTIVSTDIGRVATTNTIGAGAGLSKKLAVGDVVQFTSNFDTYLTTSIIATQGVSTVTGYSKNTDWLTCTPTITGAGTVTNLQAFCSRKGSEFSMEVYFTTGTPTATEARINFPTFQGATPVVANTFTGQKYAGDGILGAFAATYFREFVLKEPNVSYVTLSRQSSTEAGLTKQTGTGQWSTSGRNVSYKFTVPIAGWEDANLITAAIAETPTTPGLNKERKFRARVDCDAASTIQWQHGSWMSSIGNISSGACAITFTGAIFADTNYKCEADYEVNSATGVDFYFYNKTTSSVGMKCLTNGGACTSVDPVAVSCEGQ